MFRNYLKIALRNLQRNKAYAIINVLGLALSMTCGILIFTLVKYHLGFDNFHPSSERIYRVVTEEHRDRIDYDAAVPAPLGKVFRDDYTYAEIVARIATFDAVQVTITDEKDGRKFKEAVAFTESGFFDIFNYPLIAGNKKIALGEPNTAIITKSIAKKYFGDEDPINKIFRLNNKIDFKITGVLKDLPENTDRKTKIYLSYPTLKLYDEWLGSDNSWGGITDAMQCFVRLRPGATVSQVENAMAPYVKKYRPNSKNVHHYKLQPLADIHFDKRYGAVIDKEVLWVLSIIAFFLIITACVNFVNLATAQAVRRSKEVGIRKVLGSFRKQIFWQFIYETGAITFIAALVSVVLATVTIPYVNKLFNIEMSANFFSDWHLPAFISVLILVVTFLAGSYPGLILGGFQPVLAIKGKISQQSIGGFNLRRILIIAQFAISQVLVIGMIVIANQMKYAKNADLGFNKDAVALVGVGSGSSASAQHTLGDRISKIPGVENVSLCFTPPSSTDGWTTSLNYDKRSENETFAISVKMADANYVPTFNLKIIAGRNIFSADSVKEFLVNETLAKKLNLTSADQLIGKTMAINGGKMVGPIVGIVKDFHDRSFHDDINPVCISTAPNYYNFYAVKFSPKNLKATMSALEKAWTDSHPDQIFDYQFLDERIAQFYETDDLMLKLITFFSFIAIVIGCLGLYGLVSFMVSQKRKEIGIRKVLGGNLSDILWIFGKEFSRLILLALVIATPIGWLIMNKWLQNFQFRKEIGPSVFVVTILISVLIALLAGGYQSIKASVTNPIKSLRTE